MQSLLLFLVHGKFHLCQTIQGKLNCKFHKLELWDSNSATVRHWHLGTILPAWERHQIQCNILPPPVHSSPQKPAHLKGITRMLLLTGEGDVSLLEKNPSAGRAVADTAPHAQSASAEEHFMFKSSISNTEVQNCSAPEFLVWVRISKGGLEGFPAVNLCT